MSNLSQKIYFYYDNYRKALSSLSQKLYFNYDGKHIQFATCDTFCDFTSNESKHHIKLVIKRSRNSNNYRLNGFLFPCSNKLLHRIHLVVFAR